MDKMIKRCKNCGKVIAISNFSLFGMIFGICSDCMNQYRGLNFLIMLYKMYKEKEGMK